VSALRRPDPLSRVLELTRRLAEEFDSVPLAQVTSAVKGAVAAAALFGREMAESLETIESIAREDLVALAATVAEQRTTALAG